MVSASQESPRYVHLYPMLEDEEKGVSQAIPSRSLQLMNGRIPVNLEHPKEVEDAFCKYMRLQDAEPFSPWYYCYLAPGAAGAITGVIVGKTWTILAGIGGFGVSILGLCAFGIYKISRIGKIFFIANALAECKNSDSQFVNYLRKKGVTQVSEDELVQLHQEFREMKRS